MYQTTDRRSLAPTAAENVGANGPVRRYVPTVTVHWTLVTWLAHRGDGGGGGPVFLDSFFLRLLYLFSRERIQVATTTTTATNDDDDHYGRAAVEFVCD